MDKRERVMGMVGPDHDAHEFNLSEKLLTGEREILEMIAKGIAFQEILDAITTLIERLAPGTRCSILLLDEEKKHLLHGSGPSLPPEYLQAINGMAIGPCTGSCGTAAYRKERVIVEDTRTDPLWAAYRGLAQRYGLGSCWSVPLCDSRGAVLGTFALYSREPRNPSEEDLCLVESAGHLAAISIEHERMEGTLRKARDQLDRRVRERTDELVEINRLLTQENRERRHAEDLLEARAREMEILNQVIMLGNEASDLSSLLDRILEVTLEFMDFESGGIYLSDEAKGVAELRHARGLPPEFVERVNQVQITTKPYNTVFIEKKPIYNECYFPEIFPEESRKWGFFSLASVPLLSKDKAVGALNITRKRRHPFSEEEKRTLQTIGRGVGTAIVKMQAEEALKQSEARYRAVVEDQTELICRYRPDGTIVFVNDAYCRYFNESYENVVGKTCCAPVSKEEHKKPRNHLSFLSPNHPIGPFFEHSFITHDGRILWQQWSERAIFDEKGQLVEFQSVGRDITDLKWAEGRLLASHRFLEIANRHTEMAPLLRDFVAEVRSITGCEAVGIRILDEEGYIPYVAYDGFSPEFYRLENLLSIHSDQCMCISVVKGKMDPGLPFCTKGGSFYINGTTRFLATVSEEEKGRTRNICNKFGYESVALVPIHLKDEMNGLIHVADSRENKLPVEIVNILEGAAMELGTAIQRVRMEEALRESEQRFRRLVETMNEGLGVQDENGLTIYVNDKLCEMLGYSPEELLGRPVRDLFDEANRSVYLKEMGRRRLGEQTSYEVGIRKKDGSLLPTLVASSPILGPQGDFRGAIAAVTDITIIKKAEKALRESEEKYRLIFENSPLGIIHFDHDGIVTAYNENLAKMGDSSGTECIGKNLYDCFQDEKMREAISVCLSGKRGYYEGYHHWPVSGKVMPLKVDYGPIVSEEDSIVGGIGIFEDISDRKRTEEELKIYTAKLEQSNQELQDFAFVASHDLQEPLRKIQVFGNRLQVKYHDFLDERGREDLDRVQKCANRMQALIQALLNYHRVTSRGGHFAAVDLSRLIQKVVSGLKGPIRQTEGRVEISDLPILEIDESRIRQLFKHMIENALKFKGEDKPIIRIYGRYVEDEIGTETKSLSTGPFYQIIVEDNGIGFDERYLSKLFVPFKRLHGPDEYEGTGMGLVICRKIAEYHGGNITAGSTPGKGAKFIVTLPVKQSGRKGTRTNHLQ